MTTSCYVDEQVCLRHTELVTTMIGKKVYCVSDYDTVDSVWTTEKKAKERAKQVTFGHVTALRIQ